MSNHYILHEEGAFYSTELFIFNGKICFRSNSSGGEHLLYVPIECERQLLSCLQNQIDFGDSEKEVPEVISRKDRQKILLDLLAEKYSYGDKDPIPDIRHFFDENDIKPKGEYWPDSDRF